MTTKTLDFDNITQKLFWFFFSMVILLIVTYLYATFSLTVSVVERNEMAQVAYDLEEKVGKLEIEYMRIQNSVTLGYAKSLGFTEVQPKFTEDISVKLSLVH
jgi:Golgi nucleoside diphosphatase